jgi:hypothetical protein
MARKASQWYTTDPTVTDSGSDPFNWNEVTGSVSIDTGGGAVVLPEVDGETLEIDRKLEVHRGDSPAPVCFIPGKGEINRTFSAVVTDGTIPIMKSVLYGTTTPTDGQAVSATVQTAALQTVYTKNANRSLTITTPKVVLNPEDFEVGPQAEGGKMEVTFGGRCLNSGATAMLTIVAKTGDTAAYV